MKKMILFLVLISLTFPGVAACMDTSRQPAMMKDELPGVYKVELWSEHEFYEFGEPVNLRATLTNVSTNAITFRGKSDVVPVLDINVRAADWPGHEEIVWSKQNPAQVEYQVTLAPQESYAITWTVPLSFRTSYVMELLWVDPREGIRLSRATGFSHGERLPNP